MWRSDVQWCDIRGWMQMVLTPYDLFSWNKHNINFNIINRHLNTLLKAFWRCSLCELWFLFITPGSSFLLPPASCCLLPRWGLTVYLPPCFGGPDPTSPSSPELTPFPSVSRQRPTLVLGTISTASKTYMHMHYQGYGYEIYFYKLKK
jgi:hypothetical protein